MSEIIVEKAGKVVSVVLDRPPVNALTMALYQRIAEVFEDIGSWTTSIARCCRQAARARSVPASICASSWPPRSRTIRDAR